MMELVAQAAPVLPDPNHFASVGWVVVILVAVLMGVNAVLNFYKEHLREQPRPGDTYLSIPNFEKVEEERKADRREIKDSLKGLTESLASSNKYQAKARQRIHRRQNAMENSLYYLAGKYEAAGDHIAAKVIQQKLREGTQEGGGDDGE